MVSTATSPAKTAFGSESLARILAGLRMTCVDVGARGGITKDLAPLASSVDAVGFEPDAGECERLSEAAQQNPGPWRTLRFVPAALAGDGGARPLRLYRNRDCSSFYEADVELAQSFARGEYFLLDGTVEVPTTSLDEAAEAYGFDDAVYLKMDVQGAELEILRSAKRLLDNSLLVIRAEVSFMPIYRDQPLYCDLEVLLRRHGFVPVEFVELHHWRRTSRTKHPDLAPGAMPYSRGQMAHGDALFFRDPSLLPGGSELTPEAIQHTLKAAFIALAYEHVDHAHLLLTRPSVLEYLRSTHQLDQAAVERALHEASCHLARRYRRRRWRAQAIRVRDALLRRLGRAQIER
jgi:FkbM family methyltransferase